MRRLWVAISVGVLAGCPSGTPTKAKAPGAKGTSPAPITTQAKTPLAPDASSRPDVNVTGLVPDLGGASPGPLGPSPGSPLTPATTVPTAAVVPPTVPALYGTVSVPAALISNNGSGIVSNNGGTVLSNNGSSIVANNGGNIVANNGGNIVANNGGNYALLATGLPEGALNHAFMFLTNRDEQFFTNKQTGETFTSTTGATGDYSFPITAENGFPVDQDIVVNAVANGNLRLTGYMVPKAGSNELKIGIATTLATEYLRGEAFRNGKQLKNYDHAGFAKVVDLTQQALQAGAIAAVRTVKDGAGKDTAVGVFDLRVDHVSDLRNQYAVAFSATTSADALPKQISDAWKTLLGYRPAVVGSVIGNGGDLAVLSPDGFARNPNAEPADAHDLAHMAIGGALGVGVAKRGDLFVPCQSSFGSAIVRWIKPDGRCVVLQDSTYQLVAPVAIAVEQEPTDDVANHPGSLLVVDGGQGAVFRMPIVDQVLKSADGQAERWPMTVVAGENLPLTPNHGVADAANPHAADPSYVAPDGKTPKTSRWRLADEAQTARYAHLDTPVAVAIDEEGSVYIADKDNHRIRMIPGAGANGQVRFHYRQPLDNDGDGTVDAFGAEAPMAAGSLYTIAGNPIWDPSRTPDDGAGRWFGEYASSDGKPAQEAHLDQPVSLCFANGYLYVADLDNQRVRRISRATGVIETVAGNPPGAQRGSDGDFDYPSGTVGDGGPAVQAQLSFPSAVAVDAAGRVFIADNDSGRLRMVDARGVITTVAGRLHQGSGKQTDHYTDGDALYWCDLFNMRGLAVEPNGNVVFSDLKHGRIRRLYRQWEVTP